MPTSIARSLDKARRNTALKLVGWILAAVIVARVGANLLEGLRELRSHPLATSPRWSLVLLSGGVFLVAHATLVQTWRSVLGCWDERLPFWSAARIWSVSNLGRYIPGKVWQIGVMGALARNASISPVAAASSALLGTLVNIMAGFVVALAAGRVLLEQTRPGATAIATVLVVLATIGLLLLPVLLPRLAPLLGKVLRRPVSGSMPARAIVYALVGNVLSWLVYGAAFQLFVHGMLGTAAGGYVQYLAAYTISYLIGYIFLFAPAGVGVREVAMLEMLQRAGLASHPEASLVTIASRVWLTILEVAPAVLFWAHHRVRHRSPTTEPSDVPT